MKHQENNQKLRVKNFAASMALLTGFTLSVGASVGNYAAAFCIAMPIAIALYFNVK